MSYFKDLQKFLLVLKIRNFVWCASWIDTFSFCRFGWILIGFFLRYFSILRVLHKFKFSYFHLMVLSCYCVHLSSDLWPYNPKKIRNWYHIYIILPQNFPIWSCYLRIYGRMDPFLDTKSIRQQNKLGFVLDFEKFSAKSRLFRWSLFNSVFSGNLIIETSSRTLEFIYIILRNERHNIIWKVIFRITRNPCAAH